MCPLSHVGAPHRHTQITIMSQAALLVEADWLMDKDILLYVILSDCPSRVSKQMQAVGFGSTLNGMASCHCHSFVVNSNERVGLHFFVCGMDCRV